MAYIYRNGKYYGKTENVELSSAEHNAIIKKVDGLYVEETDISQFVQKELNKGLSENDYSSTEKKQVNDNKLAIAKLNGDAKTEGSVAKAVADSIAKMNRLTKKEVTVLPELEDADPNVIYLLTKDGTTKQYTTVMKDGVLDWFSESMDVQLDDYLTKQSAKDTYLALADVKKDVLKEFNEAVEEEETTVSYKGTPLLSKSVGNKVYVALNQGTALKGKLLMIGADGKVYAGSGATEASLCLEEREW